MAGDDTMSGLRCSEFHLYMADAALPDELPVGLEIGTYADDHGTTVE